jgi:hypothetical protein
MTIVLNHAIVPARDKVAAAKFFARVFGLKRGRTGYFAPVRVNKTLTLLFDDDSRFESHHYAFHVSDREFDAILRRINKEKIVFGSAPRAQRLGRRPWCLFSRSERPRARADDGAAVTFPDQGTELGRWGQLHPAVSSILCLN